MHSRVSEAERHKMYLVYKAIYDLPSELSRKNKLLTALGGGFEFPWRVIGITAGALEVLALNDYRYIKGKLCRAHLVDRIRTARDVFEIPEPLAEEQFFRLLWENDETVIATKSENKVGGSLLDYIEIDYNRGFFRGQSLVGWKHGKEEVAFLRNLHMDQKGTKALS